MFGWRKRIGGISPTVMEVVPYDFYKVAPDGVGLVGITCNIDFWDDENFARALESLTQGAEYLASRGVDFIIHFGAPLVVSRGPGYDRELVDLILSRTGVPATTSVRSALDAMRHLGTGRVAIASPYPEGINEKLERFLVANDVEVVARATRDVEFKQLQDVHPRDIYRFAGDVLRAAPDAEALYIPCPQWPAAEAVAAIERDYRRPVIASDPADFWAAFSALGIRGPMDGCGLLLASLRDG